MHQVSIIIDTFVYFSKCVLSFMYSLIVSDVFCAVSSEMNCSE